MLQMLSENNFSFGVVGENSALFSIPSGFPYGQKVQKRKKGSEKENKR